MKHFLRNWQPVALFFGVACVLNIVWEALQVPLFQDFAYTLGGWLILLWASLGDAFYITVTWILFFRVYKTTDHSSIWWRVVGYCGVLLGIAYLVERRGLLHGWWSYTDAMPLIFQVGAVPFVELVATGLGTLVLFLLIIRPRLSYA